MATKLRRFSRSNITKFIAFALTVILVTASVVLVTYLSNRDMNPEAIFVKEYVRSEAFTDGELTHAIADVINHFVNDTESIQPEPEYMFYITDGEKVKSNAGLGEILAQEDYMYLFEKGKWVFGKNTSKNVRIYLGDDITLYLVYPQEYMDQKQEKWNEERKLQLSFLISLLQAGIVSLICVIYLIAVTGRKAGDDEVHLSPYMDKIYSDIQLGVLLLTGLFWALGMENFLWDYHLSEKKPILSMQQVILLVCAGTITALTTIVCGVILLSLVRKIKAGKLLKHSLIGAIFIGISGFIRSFFNDSRFSHYPLTKSLYRRQAIFTAASGGMVFMTFILVLTTRNLFASLVPVVLEGIIIFWYFYENNRTFEEINQGFQESLAEQMKSEKMKVDLITNVSHDLKTPLTSIISYVELLAKEDLPESARDYVNILAEKSGRLKNIVSDLFDLAKSTSGNLPLELERLDLKKLVEQTLADMEDDIARSGLRIKANLPEMPVYIFSDGKKLYRVFQNVIGNALKYSLQGTRVFIDMVTHDRNVDVSIKNTASYDMDFTAEEVLQRFSRGDKSRSTEGSGLGLSIAESFARACGGSFKVEIDGDQFRVKMGFTTVD